MFTKLPFFLNNPENIFYLISSVIVVLCVFSVILAVLIDFLEFHQQKQVKKEQKSIVETGTMFLFFFGFYVLLRFQIGQISITYFPLKIFLIILGLLVLIVGAIVNIKGRFDLGKNWSNQIKIYQDHTFITNGVYKLVRHPLYASIIWMFFGSSLVYANLYAFLANICIFIPFMYYRAKQEENLLSKEFPEYKNYQKKVGMFFPKIKFL